MLKYPLLNTSHDLFLILFLYFNQYGLRQCQSKSKVSPYSITERRVPELIPVLGISPTLACDGIRQEVQVLNESESTN